MDPNTPTVPHPYCLQCGKLIPHARKRACTLRPMLPACPRSWLRRIAEVLEKPLSCRPCYSSSQHFDTQVVLASFWLCGIFLVKSGWAPRIESSCLESLPDPAVPPLLPGKTDEVPPAFMKRIQRTAVVVDETQKSAGALSMALCKSILHLNFRTNTNIRTYFLIQLKVWLEGIYFGLLFV